MLVLFTENKTLKVADLQTKCFILLSLFSSFPTYYEIYVEVFTILPVSKKRVS